MENLESRIDYTYTIKGFEEVNGIKKFVICSVTKKDGKEIPLSHYFPYEMAEKHNLTNVGDKFSFSKYEDGIPKAENLIVISRKKEKKYPTVYSHNGVDFILH